MNKLIKALIAAAILGGGGYFAYSQFQPKTKLPTSPNPLNAAKSAKPFPQQANCRLRNWWTWAHRYRVKSKKCTLKLAMWCNRAI